MNISTNDKILGKARGVSLTKKRKSAILRFKQIERESPDRVGNAEWYSRLFQYMRRYDRRLTARDMQRLVEKHPWIIEPLISDVHDLEHVSVVNVPSDLRPAAAAQPKIPSNNCQTTSNNYQSVTPPPSICSTSSYSSGNDSNQQNTKPIPVLSENEEMWKKECFKNAFNAVSMLHNICKQMPEARICLRPLKEIHRVFVRNHEKFIFPDEYLSIRDAAVHEDIPRIKVDRIYSISPEDLVECDVPETVPIDY